MKTKFVFLLLCTVGINLCAQTFEPNPMTFEHVQSLDTNLNITRFYYGWNLVDAPPALDRRYKMNILHEGGYFTWASPSLSDSARIPPLYYMSDSLDLIYNISSLAFQYKGPLDATAMLWSPWLPPQEEQTFQPFRNDRSGASLHFAQRDTSIASLDSTTQAGQSFYRWRLNKDTSSSAPVLVLSQPQYGNELVYKPNSNAESATLPVDKPPYNTTRMYLSINLRRAGVDTVDNDDTVLVIKLPYKKHFTTSWGYFSFDSLPNPASLVTTIRGQRRNFSWNTSSDLSKFTITRKMIPRTDASTKDITLSAFFFADGNEHDIDTITYTNPPFNIRWEGKRAGYVDSVSLEVYYYPASTSVALRWLKVETPSARVLFYGGKDSLIHATINHLMAKLDSFNLLQNRHYKIKRLYFQEEFDAALWQAERYANLIADTLAACEGDVAHERQMRYTTLLRENWLGRTLTLQPSVPAPYMNNRLEEYAGAEENALRLGLNGRHGKVTVFSSSDTLGASSAQLKHADYELQFHLRGHPYYYLPSDILSLPLGDSLQSDKAFDSALVYRDGLAINSVQHAIEGDMRISGKQYKDSYIFSSTPWWANMWLSPFYNYNYIDTNIGNPYHFRTLTQQGKARTLTGEEARYALWSNVILGTKGFFIYGGKMSDKNLFVRQHFLDTDTNYLSVGNVGLDFGLAACFEPREPRISSSSYFIMDDPDIGRDWLDTTGGISNYFSQSFREHFHYSDSTYRAKWHTPGIYLGFRSLRYAVDQVFSSLRSFDTTLMKLQLKSWYAKGMRKLLLGDTVLFRRYLDTNRTRHIVWRFSFPADSLPPQRDSWDSSFYDMSLLQHADYNTDSVIYIGIQNRRTNSLLRDSVTGDTLWLPMKDFQDSLVYQIYKPYAQFGARRISLPLNYVPTDTVNMWKLHVQELDDAGGGSYRRVDTIVACNADVLLNFLPGEGKLLRVQPVCLRRTIAEGSLKNSNQRKMIAFPIMQRDGFTTRLRSTDSLRYHSVYHRYDSLSGTINVYYRRSHVCRRSDAASPDVQWEPEVNLTQYGIQKLDGRMATLPCGVPTIVVRVDTLDLDSSGIVPLPQVKVYVVYACADTPDVRQYRVVENVFAAQKDSASYYPAQEVDSAFGERFKNNLLLTDEQFLSEWGAPSINASWNGNYYAYADSALGIVTRWKPANALVFDSLQSDKNVVRYRTDLLNTACQHPSLNSYSRISLRESDCALVWEERSTPESPSSYIPYTRVRLAPGISPPLTDYFLPHNLDTNTLLRSKVRSDSMVVLLNNDTTTNLQTFPMVYRGVEDYAPVGGRPLVTAHWDRVAWEELVGTRHRINLRGIDAADTNTSPSVSDYWSVWFQSSIWSLSYDLRGPQLAQGSIPWLAGDNFTNLSDSAVVLNFHRSYGFFDWHPDIWQFQYSYWSFLMRSNPVIDSIENDPTTKAALLGTADRVATGVDSRLAALPWLPASQSWQSNIWSHNRRMYHSGINDTSVISSSVEFFCKQSEEEEAEPLHYAGFVLQRDSSTTLKTLLSQAKVGTTQHLYFASQRRLWDGKMSMKTDTIYSDWFRAGNTTKLRAFTLGVNNPCVRLHIERRKESSNDRGERFEMPYLAAGNDTAKRRNSFTLLRGGNKLYRLALINTCSNGTNSPRYTEEIQLDGLTAADREADLAKSGVEEDIAIDLGNVVQGDEVLALQPNPANEKVTLRFDGLPDDYEDTHYNYELGIYTQLGQRVYSGSIRAGESQTLSTASFVPGVYRIQLKGSRGLVSLPLVIMR